MHAKEAETNKIQARTQVHVACDSYLFLFFVDGELIYKSYD